MEPIVTPARIRPQSETGKRRDSPQDSPTRSGNSTPDRTPERSFGRSPVRSSNSTPGRTPEQSFGRKGRVSKEEVQKVSESLSQYKLNLAANRALDFQSKNPELMLYRVWSSGAQSNVGHSYIPNQAWAESLRRPAVDGWANRYHGNTHSASNMPVEHVEDELRRYMGVAPNVEFMWTPSSRPVSKDRNLGLDSTPTSAIEIDELTC